jgi:hypothetical protein
MAHEKNVSPFPLFNSCPELVEGFTFSLEKASELTIANVSPLLFLS